MFMRTVIASDWGKRGWGWKGIILLLGCVGVTLVVLRQLNYGISTGPDSILYISISEDLSEWKGFNEQYYPPLFPLMVAVVIALGIENGLVAAQYVNTIAFGVTIIVLLVWISGRIESRFLILWAGSACALSPFLGNIFSYALQEPLFILFTVLSLYKLDRFLDNDKQSALIWAAVFTSLALLTRNMGIAIVATTILVVLTKKGPGFLSKVRHIAIYSVISIAPIGIWTLRAYLKSGKWAQGLHPDGFDWLISIDVASSEFIKWVLEDYGFDYLNRQAERNGISDLSVRTAFLITVTAAFGCGLIFLWRRGRNKRIKRLTVPIVFVSIYSIVLTITTAIVDFSLTSRYMAPIYVPALAAVAIYLNGLMTDSTQKGGCQVVSTKIRQPKVGLKHITMVGLFLWLALPASSSHEQIKKHLASGFGYTSKSWTESQTIQYLKSNPLNGHIWSNASRAIYANMNANIPADVEVQYHRLWPDRPNLQFADCTRTGNLDTHVVWFYGRLEAGYIRENFTEYDFTEFPLLPELTVTALLKDGVILKACHDNIGQSLNEDLILESILGDAQLVARSKFNIYLDGDRLIYTADSCRDVDTETRFFLHIYPTDRSDLPDHRKAFDFDNLDFDFYTDTFTDEVYGFTFGERCAITRNLPDYEHRMIITGQWTAQEGPLWQETFGPTVR